MHHHARRSMAKALATWLLAMPCLAYSSNAYVQTNLVASAAGFDAAAVDATLVNAWGIAIRPAGLGGHFWVTANGTGLSSQWVGDVGSTPLYQDDLRIVTVPGPVLAGGVTPTQPIIAAGTPTGVAFYGGAEHFRITQGSITHNPARFLFATDNGVISAWTERPASNGQMDRPHQAVSVIDRSSAGVQYFGLGVDEAGGRIFAANFGANPGMQVFDSQFADITATAGFDNPFAADGYQPFNVQVLGQSAFVTYALWGTPGEEVTGDGHGRVAEFALDGQLLNILGDGTGLNAPWGLAVAPEGFGAFSGHLLVGNFGDGSIAAFNPVTRRYAGQLLNERGEPIVIEGLWGLQFGNGASLGESDRLYFAAGPADETKGLFGRISASPVPEPGSLWLGAMGLSGLAGLSVWRRRINHHPVI